MSPKIVRVKQLAEWLGISVTTAYAWEEARILPARRRFGPNVRAWLVEEIDSWVESRPAESCLDTQRVESLHVAREEARTRRESEDNERTGTSE